MGNAEASCNANARWHLLPFTRPGRRVIGSEQANLMISVGANKTATRKIRMKTLKTRFNTRIVYMNMQKAEREWNGYK